MGRTHILIAKPFIPNISTHSPRVGRTRLGRIPSHTSQDFNSLAPCGANLHIHVDNVYFEAFQLTRPVWGEPMTEQRLERHFVNFNSLAPCGANPFSSWWYSKYRRFQLTRPVWGEPEVFMSNMILKRISTHSPRVGRTSSRRSSISMQPQFQLTRPVWGEPRQFSETKIIATISTHSPRVGRTEPRPKIGQIVIVFQLTRPVWGEPGGKNCLGRRATAHFNSLAPCGANPKNVITPLSREKFQLTRPVWGEPSRLRMVSDRCLISTHSPRVGRTSGF